MLLLDPPPPFESEKRELSKYLESATGVYIYTISLIENDVNVFEIGNTFNFNM